MYLLQIDPDFNQDQLSVEETDVDQANIDLPVAVPSSRSFEVSNGDKEDTVESLQLQETETSELEQESKFNETFQRPMETEANEDALNDKDLVVEVELKSKQESESAKNVVQRKKKKNIFKKLLVRFACHTKVIT